MRRAPLHPSDPHRLIGDDSVTAVDEDLLAERAWRRSSCRGEAHDQSVLAACFPGIGGAAEPAAGNYAVEEAPPAVARQPSESHPSGSPIPTAAFSPYGSFDRVETGGEALAP